MTNDILKQLIDTFVTQKEIFSNIPSTYSDLKLFATMQMKDGYRVGEIRFLTSKVLIIFWKQDVGYTIELMSVDIPKTAIKAWKDTGINLIK